MLSYRILYAYLKHLKCLLTLFLMATYNILEKYIMGGPIRDGLSKIPYRTRFCEFLKVKQIIFTNYYMRPSYRVIRFIQMLNSLINTNYDDIDFLFRIHLTEIRSLIKAIQLCLSQIA